MHMSLYEGGHGIAVTLCMCMSVSACVRLRVRVIREKERECRGAEGVESGEEVSASTGEGVCASSLENLLNL